MNNHIESLATNFPEIATIIAKYKLGQPQLVQTESIIPKVGLFGQMGNIIHQITQ